MSALDLDPKEEKMISLRSTLSPVTGVSGARGWME